MKALLSKDSATHDSHCNANGVKLAADLIESKLREAK